MSGQRILIVGGTRGTGLLIARLLVAHGAAHVRVLARDPAAAAARLGAGVTVVPGDITRPATLPPAIESATHVVFTAGVRSGRPALERTIRATEYGGIVNTLDAAQRTGFKGRLLYMTASGSTRRSIAAALLNAYKGNTLVWRSRAEDEIRGRCEDYTIIRTGILTNGRGGRRAVRLTQEPLPLSLKYWISRADVAAAFVTALGHRDVARVTMEIAWARGPRTATWADLMRGLTPDGPGRGEQPVLRSTWR